MLEPRPGMESGFPPGMEAAFPPGMSYSDFMNLPREQQMELHEQMMKAQEEPK